MTQTPQEIALEFARVIGFEQPVIEESLIFSSDYNLFKGINGLKYTNTDEVLRAAMKWLKEHDMRIVCIYPVEDEDDRYGCLIESIFEDIQASEQLADTLPQAIMCTVIEADKILKGSV